MSKFIVISDTHFHNWTEFSKPDDKYGNSRLGEQLKVLEEVFDIARDNNASIIFAGDLFHKRQSVDTRVFNAVYEAFENNRDVMVYGIPGNHDKVNNSLHSDSSLDTFQYINNTKIYTEMSHEDMGDVTFTMIPYGDEVEEIKEYLNNVKVTKDKPNILVAHLGVSGSIAGKGGHRLEGAFTYEDLHPEKFDYILLGHYHRPQVLQENDKHVYVGTLTQNNFGEEGHETGPILVDTEKGTLERIPVESTKFVTIEGSNIPDNIEKILENSYVRFTGDRGQARALENTVDDLTNVRINIEEIMEVDTRIEIDKTTDPVVITEKYMEKYYPDATEEALECIREAMTDAKV